MHTSEGDEAARRRAVFENLSRQFHAHTYPVNRDDAREMGLTVAKDMEPSFEALMWSVWLDIEHELKEREPFSAITELLNHPAAGPQLLSAVPQLDLPSNAASPSNFSAELNQVVQAGVKIEPIGFEYVNALLESERLGSACKTRGKILASRRPDLEVQYNVLSSFSGWELTYSGG